MRTTLLITAVFFWAACAVDHPGQGPLIDSGASLDGGTDAAFRDVHALEDMAMLPDAGEDSRVRMDSGAVHDGGRPTDAGDDVMLLDAGDDAPRLDAGDDACSLMPWYLDRDGDGYGSTLMMACDRPGDGWVMIRGDCDDNDDGVHPGVLELCDMKDNNCDGVDSGNVCDHRCVSAFFIGHHYLICERSVTRPTAAARCAGYGGYLINISNDLERIAAGAATDEFRGQGWWLGLTDRMTEGELVWDQSEPEALPAYPFEDGNTEEEDCVDMRGSGDHDEGHRWRHMECSSHHAYICEGL